MIYGNIIGGEDCSRGGSYLCYHLVVLNMWPNGCAALLFSYLLIFLSCTLFTSLLFPFFWPKAFLGHGFRDRQREGRPVSGNKIWVHFEMFSAGEPMSHSEKRKVKESVLCTQISRVQPNMVRVQPLMSAHQNRYKKGKKHSILGS